MTFPVHNSTGTEWLSAEVEQLARRHAVPGLCVAVVNRDRLIAAVSVGTADLATGRPATLDTRFLWFSMTKVVTATTVWALIDDGRLDLDAPIDRYLPWFPSRPEGVPLVRTLLDHTSGLANPAPLRWVHPMGDPPPDQADMLHRLLSRRRAVREAPGGPAHYSNVGYLCLAAAVSAVAGRPFERVVHERVLAPVGMTQTGFGPDLADPLATGYVRVPWLATPVVHALLPRWAVGRRIGANVALCPFLVDGAGYGGLLGPVLDAARFLRLHLGDGVIDGHRVLQSETAQAMRRISASGRRFDHSLGWFRDRRHLGPFEHVEHYGGGAGYWNVLRLYPERGVGVVAMANTTKAYDFAGLFDRLAAECGAGRAGHPA